MPHEPHSRQDCVALFDKLSAYLDNELDADTCAEIRAHAESCVACKSCIDTLKQTVALCHGLEAESPSPEFSRQLKSLIDQMTRSDRG
jgi:anti-sigma factor RsiW